MEVGEGLLMRRSSANGSVSPEAGWIREENPCLDKLANGSQSSFSRNAGALGEEIEITENGGAVVADDLFNDRLCPTWEMFVAVIVAVLQFPSSLWFGETKIRAKGPDSSFVNSYLNMWIKKCQATLFAFSHKIS